MRDRDYRVRFMCNYCGKSHDLDPTEQPWAASWARNAQEAYRSGKRDAGQFLARKLREVAAADNGYTASAKAALLIAADVAEEMWWEDKCAEVREGIG